VSCRAQAREQPPWSSEGLTVNLRLPPLLIRMGIGEHTLQLQTNAPYLPYQSPKKSPSDFSACMTTYRSPPEGGSIDRVTSPGQALDNLRSAFGPPRGDSGAREATGMVFCPSGEPTDWDPAAVELRWSRHALHGLTAVRRCCTPSGESAERTRGRFIEWRVNIRVGTLDRIQQRRTC
jgi:hypothetical protein